MTPKGYENYVCEYFKKLGYDAETTPYSGDYGVDVFAEKGNEKIAIQAKMYGNNRKVNRQMILELHGSKDYFNCTKAVLATNGEVMPDAIEVAKKLKIELLYINEPADLKREYTNQSSICQGIKGQKIRENAVESITLDNYEYSFDNIWEKYIMPLKGMTLTNSRGTNLFTDVNWAEVTRITSNKKYGTIGIEPFKTAVEVLLREGSITREYIDHNYEKRASSGIILILSQVPFFRLEEKPKLRLVFTGVKDE